MSNLGRQRKTEKEERRHIVSLDDLRIAGDSIDGTDAALAELQAWERLHANRVEIQAALDAGETDVDSIAMQYGLDPAKVAKDLGADPSHEVDETWDEYSEAHADAIHRLLENWGEEVRSLKDGRSSLEDVAERYGLEVEDFFDAMYDDLYRTVHNNPDVPEDEGESKLDKIAHRHDLNPKTLHPLN